jgi:ElaB/YqjD/DUF883 family membrane-anchored ribosome-binding protein
MLREDPAAGGPGDIAMESENGGERIADAARRQAAGMTAGMQDQLDELRGYAEEAGSVVREYAREHPWTAIGIAAGVGFVLGRLLSRL